MTNANCVAKMLCVNGSGNNWPTLTIGNTYEVLAWVGSAQGLQGLVIDDTGNLFVASYMATASEWTPVAV